MPVNVKYDYPPARVWLMKPYKGHYFFTGYTAETEDGLGLLGEYLFDGPSFRHRRVWVDLKTLAFVQVSER